MSENPYTRLPSSNKESEETPPSYPHQASERHPNGLSSSGSVNLQDIPISDEPPSNSATEEATSERVPESTVVPFKICLGDVPTRHLRVLFARGLSREEYIEQLCLLYPEIFDQVPSDRITFSVKINLNYTLVSNSSWDDVMVKRKPGQVLVKIKLRGLEAWIYKAKWASIVAFPFVVVMLLVMEHWIIALELIFLFIFLMLKQYFEM